MSLMKRISVRSLLGGAVALTAISGSVPMVQAQHEIVSGPVVVELFLSQSCGQCIPAIEHLTKLAAKKDVIALSWHVDYWNDMKTRNGQWVDPFSNAAFTMRQRHYNEHIRRKSSVYTPQMVIGGAHEAPGAKTNKVEQLMEEVRTRNNVATIETRLVDDEIIFDIKKPLVGGDAYLVTFLPYIQTDIDSGDNAGQTVHEINVITDVQTLGIVPIGGTQLSTRIPDEDTSCALIVQEPDQGSIIAATYCPKIEQS